MPWQHGIGSNSLPYQSDHFALGNAPPHPCTSALTSSCAGSGCCCSDMHVQGEGSQRMQVRKYLPIDIYKNSHYMKDGTAWGPAAVSLDVV